MVNWRKKVVASIVESIGGEPSRPAAWQRLKDIFCQESLQMITFTITEKGYSLKKHVRRLF